MDLELKGIKCTALIFVSVLVNGTYVNMMTLAFAHAISLMIQYCLPGIRNEDPL